MKKILSALALLLLSFSAEASQNAVVLPTVGPYPGLTMLFNINAAFNSLQTNFSGAACSGIATPQTYQFCFDTSANALRIYDGSAWQPMGNLAGSQWSAISNGVPFTIPASTGSSNAYAVTYASVPTAYVTGQHYPFIANFANTGAATLNVNTLGTKAIKKQGGVALGSADIGSGAVVDTVYDGTNLQMVSQTGNSASGTVTSVGCGTGLSGGTITTAGTCALATITANQILANPTGSTAAPIGTSLSGLIDTAMGSAQGSILYRGASNWGVLTPGTNGQSLITQGASANVAWAGANTYVLLGSQTASNSASISFTGLAGGSYSEYVLEFDNVIPANNGNFMEVRISTGSGFISTTSYTYQVLRYTASGGAASSGSTGDNDFVINAVPEPLSNGTPFAGEFHIYGADSTSTLRNANWFYNHQSSNGNYIAATGGGQVSTQASIIDGMTIFMSGNISTGNFRLYGLKNS